MPDIIERIKAANIIGRGGAEYPAHLKWTAVKAAQSSQKYVICNASEREPNVHKDFHLLEKYTEKIFTGMKIAMTAVGANEGIFNLNEDYYKKLKAEIDALAEAAKKEGFAIRIFEEYPSYIGGDETALLNAIEGLRCEPRSKPPFPTDKGLFGMPTLIHNVETLFEIACVADGTYDGKRFFTLSGQIKNPGVYHLPAVLTVLEVLEATNNLPKAAYFAQVGGGASGNVYNSDQLKTQRAHGTAAIIVHLLSESPRQLLLEWCRFFHRESCGKCTPCREGTYQLVRLLEDNRKIPWEKMDPILEVLEKTSFCPLGRSVPVPVLDYRKNVLPLR